VKREIVRGDRADRARVQEMRDDAAGRDPPFL
jgi:hypothetical protein